MLHTVRLALLGIEAQAAYRYTNYMTLLGSHGIDCRDMDAFLPCHGHVNKIRVLCLVSPVYVFAYILPLLMQGSHCPKPLPLPSKTVTADVPPYNILYEVFNGTFGGAKLAKCSGAVHQRLRAGGKEAVARCFDRNSVGCGVRGPKAGVYPYRSAVRVVTWAPGLLDCQVDHLGHACMVQYGRRWIIIWCMRAADRYWIANGGAWRGRRST